MQKWPDIAGRVASLLLVLIFGWFLYIFVISFSDAEPAVKASIIAGLFAVVSLAFTYWKERSRAIKDAHREQKISIYGDFFDIIFTVQDNIRKGEHLNEEYVASEIFIEKLLRVKRGAMFYGSPEVINALSEWMLAVPSQNGDPRNTLRNVGKVLLAMRNDIGLSNRGLDSLNIHQMNITDNLAQYTSVAGQAQNEHP